MTSKVKTPQEQFDANVEKFKNIQFDEWQKIALTSLDMDVALWITQFEKEYPDKEDLKMAFHFITASMFEHIMENQVERINKLRTAIINGELQIKE